MDVEAKLGRFLDKLLEPAFRLKDPEYLTLVVDQLRKKSNEPLCRRYAVDWPRRAISTWKPHADPPPPPAVLAFALEFASLGGSIEETFVKANASNTYEQLLDRSLSPTPTASPAVRLGLVRLVASFLAHKSGVQWIVSTSYWSRVLLVAVRGETLYLQKEGCSFVAELLHKSVAINEAFCAQAMRVVLAPLLEPREQPVYQALCPTLGLLAQLLEALLERSIGTDDYKVFVLLKERFRPDKLIGGILARVDGDDDFVFDLSKVLFVYGFFELVHREGQRGVAGVSIDVEKAIQTASGLFDVFLDAANRGTVSNMLKLCYFGHIYWRIISAKMPTCVSPDRSELHFEDQLLLIQLYPAVMVSNKLLGNTLDRESEEDDFREDMVTELCRNVIHPTFRAVFRWRSYLLRNFSFDHAVLALKYVLHSRQFYTRERASMAFRILVYGLKDITKTLMEQPEQVLVLSREANYICLLMETIAVLVSEFDLTWKDSPETICVTEMTFNFLTFPVWPKKLVVKGLKLLELAVSKGMSPSQALLLDTMKDSSLRLMAPMIYAKLHDPHWEIRDGALDVVRTIAHNSREKFPSFRRVILDGGFPTICVKMSTGDANPYVKASSLKCLQEMVGVDEYWNKLLDDDRDITGEALRIVHEDPEAVVRCEAASLVHRIYVDRDVPEPTIDDVYDVMSDAAIVDLHWEVRARSLEFWGDVIDRHLTHQGMIDGEFPSITFSKEHRKIVQLDRDEVRRRIAQVLERLDRCGCLGAFAHALEQREFDVEVYKTASRRLERLVSLIGRYGVVEQDFARAPPPVPMAFAPDKPPQRVVATQAACAAAIDDILASHDLGLLEAVLSSTGEKNLSEVRGRSSVSPADFLRRVVVAETTVVEDDVEADGLESLLDDVLGDHAVDLSMDCY